MSITVRYIITYNVHGINSNFKDLVVLLFLTSKETKEVEEKIIFFLTSLYYLTLCGLLLAKNKIIKTLKKSI